MNTKMTSAMVAALGEARPIASRFHNESAGDIAMKVQTLAEIAGADPAKAAREVRENPAQAQDLLKKYTDQALKSLGSKKAEELTDAQRAALGDVLTITDPNGKNWSQQREEDRSKHSEEAEKKRQEELIKRLNELLAQEENEEKGWAGMLGFGGFGSPGKYVGGDDGMIRFNVLERMRNGTEEEQRLAKKYTDPLTATDPRARVVEMARRFVGESEHAGNNGPLVAMCMGYQGGPYCGGGLNMVYDRVFGSKLFDQKSYRSAGSWMQIGQAYGAVTQEAKVGNIVMFPGMGASGYHVGMITEVTADGRVKYLDFNGGSTVKEVDMSRAAVAYVDPEILARNKLGKSLDQLVVDAEKEFEDKSKKADIVPATGTKHAAAPPTTPKRQKEPEPALG
jgi:hypothetical protein